jgi:hypothetical protein
LSRLTAAGWVRTTRVAHLGQVTHEHAMWSALQRLHCAIKKDLTCSRSALRVCHTANFLSSTRSLGGERNRCLDGLHHPSSTRRLAVTCGNAPSAHVCP